MCFGKIIPADYHRTSLTGAEFDRLDDEFSYPIRLFDAAPLVRLVDDLELVKADQWSLTPRWSKTLRPTFATFNARLDSLITKKTWQAVFPKKRCLIPAAGFFENGPEPGEKKKRPYYVRYRDERSFYLAGLWSEWVDKETGEVFLTYTVLTTDNNGLMEHIGHKRMPCIVKPAYYDFWLDTDVDDKEALIACLKEPENSSALKCHPVSYAVNYRAEHGPEVIEPIGDEIYVEE